ncbi:MAG TPA: GNAT family acetyltransferase [Ornithinimicrobium sp.]|uniref:GNAT family acetyltransferase n=1 Tax=Ornithinimicrobium sp. TaxID=1977084 RepID=UPI002B481234|nr:GNAT family acetyltransferase [Ornithinimicrobium sp.]HKJ12032.1 GNAT family acetyltransferase [Ornithinimicrobium sp.]
MRIRPFERADTDVVVALWHEVGITRPWNDPHRDIERKMSVQPELFLVGIEDGEVVASAMSGFDGHRGWLYYFAVSPTHQGRGLGRAMLDEVERLLIERGCPKLNVQIRDGASALVRRYEQWGYATDGATGMGKRLIPD